MASDRPISEPQLPNAEASIFGPPILRAPIGVLRETNIESVIELLLLKPSPRRRVGLSAATVVCGLVVLAAGLVVWGWGYRTQRDNPGFWQVSLCGMLFWLSVSQGMVALSAILRLTHASWRYKLNRLMDIASLYGLWVFALLPFLIAARDRIYALGSTGFASNVWRLAGSAGYDALAIGIAYVSGWLLLYTTSMPDFAAMSARIAKDSKSGQLYKCLAPLWLGESRQWRALRTAEGVLVVGVIASFVASQTVIGWDFQLASARDWDSSIFAPLYTIGSLLAAAAMTTLAGTLAGRFIPNFSLLEIRHYDNLGRIMLALGLLWFYMRWCDYLTAWYEHIPSEWLIQSNRVAAFPILTVIMGLGCFAIPVFCNMLSRTRRSPAAQCAIAVCVLIGIAVQRYLDTVPTFAPNYPISALAPNAGSCFVFVGMGAMFVLTYLLSARYLPIVSIWGFAKGWTRSCERRMGNGSVTIMLEDPPIWEV